MIGGLLFTVFLLTAGLWALGERAIRRHRARYLVARLNRPRVQGLRAVATAEHLVHDRYMVIGDLYDTPSPNRGGG
jgi:hypothetical protein